MKREMWNGIKIDGVGWPSAFLIFEIICKGHWSFTVVCYF